MISRVDPWVQTILSLSSQSQCQMDNAVRTRAANGETFHDKAHVSASSPRELIVSLIERTTPSTVTIAWRDSTSCFYGEQVWRVAGAKVSGVCVLSGKRIRRGDRIYHPQRSNPAPVNARAMILESALDLMAPMQSMQMEILALKRR